MWESRCVGRRKTISWGDDFTDRNLCPFKCFRVTTCLIKARSARAWGSIQGGYGGVPFSSLTVYCEVKEMKVKAHVISDGVRHV